VAVVGKLPSKVEWAEAKKRVDRFKTEFENPKIGLERFRNVWNQIARDYFKLLNLRRIESEIEILKTNAEISRSDNIASLGSGPSVIEAFFAKHIVPKGQVTCIDFSPQMSKIATEVKEKAKAENMSIRTASAASTKLPSGSQDKVIIGQTNLADTVHWKSVLREAMRIIRKSPRAKLAVSFAVKDRKEIAEVEKSLRENGFQPERSIVYYSDKKMEAVMLVSRLPVNSWAVSKK